MSEGAAGAPTGYTRFLVSGADVVAQTKRVDTVRQALAGATLYGYAARHPRRRALQGRSIAYAVPLPDGETRVVVRHSHHGGLLAGITGDLFLPPTRAPHELATALRLAAAGVATPEVVAYATYPAGRVLRRSDVATGEIAGGLDLGEMFRQSTDARALASALDATAALLRALEAAGARHPDLNMKNVLIAGGGAAPRAVVLDVDRIRFGTAGDRAIGAANLRRLLRSARKLRQRDALAIPDDALRRLAAAAGHPAV